MARRAAPKRPRKPILSQGVGELPALHPGVMMCVLSRYLEPTDFTMRTMKRVYNPSARVLASFEAALVERGHLSSTEQALTSAGEEFLHASVSSAVLKAPSALQSYRAFAGSIVTGIAATKSNLSILRDVKSVTAALVARSLAGPIDVATDSSQLTAMAVRLLGFDLLRRAGVKVVMTDAWHIKPIDPLVMDLFEAATGTREIDRGLQRGIYPSFISDTDARWRKLTSMSFDSMALKPRLSQTAGSSPLAGRVAKALSSILSSRWMPIYQAFDAYRELERVSLQDFKDALGVIASAEQIELAPIDVPQLYPTDTRTKSATVLGGLTFHLVRLPR